MKRKRKEHRSLDSILFEDDGELEYFDVLNLLPLSNVRLEYDEADSTRDGNFARKNERVHISRDLRALEYHGASSAEEASPSASSNATDEEKCKEHTVKEDNSARTDDDTDKVFHEDHDSSREAGSARHDSRVQQEIEESFDENSEISLATNKFVEQRVASSSKRERHDTDVGSFVIPCEEDRKIEEVDDYKSIWISDNEDQDAMSRRPQILKVVDNDVTKRRHRRSVVEIDAIVENVPKDKKSQEITKGASGRVDAPVIKSNDNANKEDEIREKNAEVSVRCDKVFTSARENEVRTIIFFIYASRCVCAALKLLEDSDSVRNLTEY